RQAGEAHLGRSAKTSLRNSMTLKSEFETTCPCCQATLVIDTNLRRVVRHEEPVRGDRPELSEAQQILAQEAARREALFHDSVAAEKTRGDALSRRFEEALKQARQEPITKPTRDFDLDWPAFHEGSSRPDALATSLCQVAPCV